MQKELFIGRANKGQRSLFQEKLFSLRILISSVIGSDHEEIAVTSNTTEGINIVVWGLDLGSNDEILTTNAEHFGVLSSLYTLHKLRKVRVNYFDCSSTNNHIFNLEKFFRMITPRTKLIILSHIFWESGNINPVKEVCNYAKKKGIRVLIDGAQAVGSIPVNVKDINADFYTFPAHKWLLGPEGIGFLYISNEALNSLNQVFAGNASFRSHDGKMNFLPSIGSKRFEIGTRFRPIITGMITGLEWLLKDIGLTKVYKETQHNMEFFKNYIREKTNLNVVTNNVRNIMSISLPKNVDARSFRKQLEKVNVYVKDIEKYNAIRISISFFHNEAQINQFMNYVIQLLSKQEAV